MTAYIKPEEWLQVIRKEYLQEFVRQGGAAVKFVVPLGETEPLDLKSALHKVAQEEDFHFAFVDAAVTKIHLIEQLFYQVARQVDWDGLAYSFLRRLLEAHYKLPDNQQEFNLRQIALLNGYEEREMRPLINNRLRDKLFRDYAMTQEFRIAMLKLCQYQLDPAEVSQDLCAALKDWLRGELRLISALKPALIFRKISRHNARHMLFSLSHWLKLAGKNGLVLMLDISRYTADRSKEPDGTLYYSTRAMLDCYEVLRQFIDGTDECEYCLTVGLAPLRFITEGERRSLEAYQALKVRIADEVHDKVYVNPLSSLIRVCSCSYTSDAIGR